MAEAIVYNKYTPIMHVDVKENVITRVYEIYNEHMLPICLQNSQEIKEVNEWFKKRAIPKNRDGLEEVEESFPEYGKSGKNRFSLSDQYWLQYDTSDTWDRGNFFTNQYDETAGMAFFSPWMLEENQTFGPSPDFTTNGTLKKTWKKQNDGTSHLIKAGCRRMHQEPITEVLASEVLQKINIIPFVKYSLTIEGMTLCSECANFVDKDTEFVPAAHIYFREPRTGNESYYHHMLKMCAMYEIKGAKDYIDRMIVADRILGNDDRHLGNFGFLRSADTGKIIGFAPLFDSGSAYGGKTNRVNKQRLFEEQRDEAMKQVLKQIDYKRLADHKDLFELIDVYPDINRRQREFIKRHVLNTERDIKKRLVRNRYYVGADREGR